MRRHEGREHVVAAVAGGPVAVLPAVVGGEQCVQGGQQVVVAARTGFQDGDSRGRVRYEDVEQAVAAGGRPGDCSQSDVRSVTVSVVPVVMCRTLVVKAEGMGSFSCP